MSVTCEEEMGMYRMADSELIGCKVCRMGIVQYFK